MTLKEHIDDIRDNLEKGLFTSEAAVSDSIVRRLLDALDWPIYNPQLVFPQYPVEGGKVDFALCHPLLEPCAFIEVKHIGNIEGAEEQLFRYAFRRGVPIAILTDGQKWRFFYPIGQGDYRERKVHELDLIEDNSEKSAERLSRYLNYASIRTGEAIKAIEEDYRNVSRQRQVATRLPEAWNKLVEEADEFLLHAVAEKTESLCGYRPNDEQVLDFLKVLEKKTELTPREIPPPSTLKLAPIFRNIKSKALPERLVVTMPDGERINHNVAAVTFTEVIEKLGIEQVKRLEYKLNKIPLISTSKHSKYKQRKSGRYYIITHSGTKRKKALLEKISLNLGVQLKVEITDK